MAKIKSEKQKNYALASKKSLLGLTPGPVGGKSPSNLTPQDVLDF